MNALTNLDALSRADRQAQIVHALSAVMPAHTLLYTLEDTVPYECDGLTAYRERPLVVALPETESQVQAVLKTCHALAVPVVARGAGTGLSGGAMPHKLGVTLSMASSIRFSKWTPCLEPQWFNAAFATWPFQRLLQCMVCTTHPIRPAKLPAPLVATWPKTQGVCIA